MQQIYQSSFMEVFYYPHFQLVRYCWLPHTKEMKDTDYQYNMLEVLKYGQAYQVKNVIADWRKSEFVVVPELQVWLNVNVIQPVIRTGMKRLFVIMREDLIQELTLEQIIDEDKTQAFNTFYLNTEDKAWELLKSIYGEKEA